MKALPGQVRNPDAVRDPYQPGYRLRRKSKPGGYTSRKREGATLWPTRSLFPRGAFILNHRVLLDDTGVSIEFPATC